MYKILLFHLCALASKLVWIVIKFKLYMSVSGRFAR